MMPARAETGEDLPAAAHVHHRQILASGGDVPTGLLFDTRSFAMMSITHPPNSETPDLNTDKDGERVLILINGDLALQIGQHSYHLEPGDAVLIPRGTCFGRSRSKSGAHLLLVRSKPPRSFSMYR